jgi:hypothetical protein
MLVSFVRFDYVMVRLGYVRSGWSG